MNDCIKLFFLVFFLNKNYTFFLMRMYELCTKLYFIFLVLFFWNENDTFFLNDDVWLDAQNSIFFSFDFKRMHKTLSFCFDCKRMHKTLFFTFFYENAWTMHKTLFCLFYISFKMYFQNSSYVIEYSMDAFEDVWCICECMMYVVICDQCLDM